MKILSLTSIRSDYDLMSGLYQKLDADPDIDFKVLVTGAHLSASFGMTVTDIERDALSILSRVESLIAADSPSSRLKTLSVALIGSIDVVRDYSPDLILFAGDREDVLMGAMLGTFLQIPTVHFFSGDHASDGHIDNPIRHATSKLSSYMFVSIEEHRQRLLAIGEAYDRIHVIGSVALDKYSDISSWNRSELFSKIVPDVEPRDFAIVIFHPIASEKDRHSEILSSILEGLRKRNIFAFLSTPNTDPGSQNLLETIRKLNDDPHMCFYGNLPRPQFLSLMMNARMIIGNSSAGILESGSIPIPAINVGERQKGRLHGPNVIFCDATQRAIGESIEKALSPEFRRIVNDTGNIYGDGRSVNRAVDLLKTINFGEKIQKPEDPLTLRLNGDGDLDD